MNGTAVTTTLLCKELTRRFLSADPLVAAAGDPQALNRFAYVRNNPLRFVDPSGLYLLAVCGWKQTCTKGNGGRRNTGSIEQWRSAVIAYWMSGKSLANFGRDRDHLNFVFDLFAGAYAKGFRQSSIIKIFDAAVWDASFGRQRFDAGNAARELEAFAAEQTVRTLRNITYFAGFSFGGVAVHEYLFGVSKGALFGVRPKGVYLTGAPDIYAINLTYNSLINALNGCSFLCPSHPLFEPLRVGEGTSEGFNIRAAFAAFGESVSVIARSAPYRISIGWGRGTFELDVSGTLSGGAQPLPDEAHCHCVDPVKSWDDAQRLFR